MSITFEEAYKDHKPHLPIEYYTHLVLHKKKFTSLLYGDGEFLVATGLRRGVKQFTVNLEEVSSELEEGIKNSLLVVDPTIIRGTDLNLINWRDYKGGDDLAELGVVLDKFLGGKRIDWVNGEVWENAVREYKFAPMFQALQTRDCVVIGNKWVIEFLNQIRIGKWAVQLPIYDAYKAIKSTLNGVRVGFRMKELNDPVFIVCAGLSAIPTIMKLRESHPDGTFLDLGSTFDIFMRRGQERGWRRECCQDLTVWKKLVDLNLKGVR